jgi:hypothetical protein
MLRRLHGATLWDCLRWGVQRHSGAAKAICRQRDDAYVSALRANPKRWSRSTRCWRQPAEVWINRPTE